MKDKTIIALAIDPDQKKALKDHLSERGGTLSAFMRKLITQYMQENNVKAH